jgi:hypothetical protein
MGVKHARGHDEARALGLVCRKGRRPSSSSSSSISFGSTKTSSILPFRFLSTSAAGPIPDRLVFASATPNQADGTRGGVATCTPLTTHTHTIFDVYKREEEEEELPKKKKKNTHTIPPYYISPLLLLCLLFLRLFTLFPQFSSFLLSSF